MDPDDDFLTPAARLCELAEILAIGILRLHVREALVANSDVDPAKKLAEPGSAHLEVPAETVLSFPKTTCHSLHRPTQFRQPRSGRTNADTVVTLMAGHEGCWALALGGAARGGRQQ